MEATKQQCPKCSKQYVLDEEAFSKHVASCKNPTTELQSFRPDDLRKLIAEFRSEVKRSGDDKLADELEDQLLNAEKPQLTRETKQRLARWCKTGSIYSDGMEVAWKISRLLFGKIIQRAD